MKSFKSNILIKNNNIEISNKSEEEMKQKSAEIINNFKNKEFVNQLKKDLRLKGDSNGIYKKQEELKRTNPENLAKNIDFIKSFIKHNESVRKENINNFKIRNINEPDFYEHKNIVADYVKNPDLHLKKYTENLQQFSRIYSDYIKNNLPKENYVEDSNFC